MRDLYAIGIRRWKSWEAYLRIDSGSVLILRSSAAGAVMFARTRLDLWIVSNISVYAYT